MSLENNRWFKSTTRTSAPPAHGPRLFHSESGISTPLALPDVYKELPHKYPGLDVAQSSTGVIWTTERAAEVGFTYEDASMFVVLSVMDSYLP